MSKDTAWSIHIELKDNPKVEQAIREGLTAHAAEAGHPINRWHLSIAACDSQNDAKILGGLSGYARFSWLYVSLIWVDPEQRGNGIGKALLEAVETEAIKGGCHGVYLTTYGFQARSFYEQHGYKVFGDLPDEPDACSMYFLRKMLV